MLSFTYGDSHPTFSPRIKDGKEYRKKLYTYQEMKMQDKNMDTVLQKAEVLIEALSCIQRSTGKNQ